MYTERMNEKTKFAPRMSLPLSEEERDFVLDLKHELARQRRHLKEFVMEALREQARKEKFPVAHATKKEPLTSLPPP